MNVHKLPASEMTNEVSVESSERTTDSFTTGSLSRMISMVGVGQIKGWLQWLAAGSISAHRSIPAHLVFACQPPTRDDAWSIGSHTESPTCSFHHVQLLDCWWQIKCFPLWQMQLLQLCSCTHCLAANFHPNHIELFLSISQNPSLMANSNPISIKMKTARGT